MAKKTMVKDYDQFQLRLPPGMRDRIKVKADRAGMSMNEAIVWCLDEYFPAPATLEQRIEGLATSVAALKHGNDLETQIDDLVEQIDKTLREIAYEKIPVSTNFADKVATRIEEWNREAYEAMQDRPFDDDSYTTPTFSDGGIDDPFADHEVVRRDDKATD